jgi:hypothetical protein
VYRGEELENFLLRHGIDPTTFPEIRILFEAANTLTSGKRRNVWTPPVYPWEIHYGPHRYQIGPVGCPTALTEHHANILRQITGRLDTLLNYFPYDPETLTFTIPCTPIDTCYLCSPSQRGTIKVRSTSTN